MPRWSVAVSIRKNILSNTTIQPVEVILASQGAISLDTGLLCLSLNLVSRSNLFSSVPARVAKVGPRSVFGGKIRAGDVPDDGELLWMTGFPIPSV
jgi:hypothetical protein